VVSSVEPPVEGSVVGASVLLGVPQERQNARAAMPEHESIVFMGGRVTNSHDSTLDRLELEDSPASQLASEGTLENK
jgi:hypothetical protein